MSLLQASGGHSHLQPSCAYWVDQMSYSVESKKNNNKKIKRNISVWRWNSSETDHSCYFLIFGSSFSTTSCHFVLSRPTLLTSWFFGSCSHHRNFFFVAVPSEWHPPPNPGLMVKSWSSILSSCSVFVPHFLVISGLLLDMALKLEKKTQSISAKRSLSCSECVWTVCNFPDYVLCFPTVWLER